MTSPARRVTHGSFVIERVYPATPARVFAAWSDPAFKGRWFHPPDEAAVEHSLDFRVGGRETSRGGAPGGGLFAFGALYHDIVPEERIIYSYDMELDGDRISVSLVTVEFRLQRAGTHLMVTEHGTYLEGSDTVEQRSHGTGELLDQLGAALADT